MRRVLRLMELTLLALAVSQATPLVRAFSVTPFLGVSVGGSSADSVLATATSAAGVVFIGGTSASTDVNSTVTTGGALGTTAMGTVFQHTYGAATRKNGFLSAFAESGAPLWRAEIVGSGDESVTAMAAGSNGLLYVCGSFNSTDAMYVSPAGVMSAAFVGNASDTPDVFYLALSMTTGALAFQGSMHSLLPDVCNAVAYTSVGGGNVVFAGAAVVPDASGAYSGPTFYSPGGFIPTNPVYAAGSLWLVAEPSKVMMNDPDGGFGASVGYWLRVNATTGWNATLAPTALPYPILAIGGDWITALEFDYGGNLYIGFNTWSYDNQFMTDEYNTNNVQPALMTISATAFQSDADALALIAPIWAQLNSQALTVLFSPIVSSAMFGSFADDMVTGIAVLQANVANPALSTVAISGWTNSSQSHLLFNASAYQFLSVGSASSFLETPYTYTTNRMSAWVVINNGQMNSPSGAVNMITPAGVLGVSGPIVQDSLTTDLFVALSVTGTGAFSVAGMWTGSSVAHAFPLSAASWDAAIARVNSTSGVTEWVQTVTGSSAGDDWGLAVGVQTIPGGSSGTFDRPLPWLAGSFSGNLSAAASSSAPLTIVGRGATDGFAVAFDDVDDCGFDPTVSRYPFGANACNYSPGVSVLLGASLCVDEPEYPLCFCNMNVTNSGGGGLCNAHGWDCGFTVQYYFDLLNVCNCSQLANPSANPLNDIEPRLVQCAPSVCTFHELTGVYSQCLSLVLNFVATCSVSPSTSATDKALMDAFTGLYANCPSGSTTGASSTGTYDFGAAPASAAPSAATVATTIAAAAAAAAFAVAGAGAGSVGAGVSAAVAPVPIPAAAHGGEL